MGLQSQLAEFAKIAYTRFEEADGNITGLFGMLLLDRNSLPVRSIHNEGSIEEVGDEVHDVQIKCRTITKTLRRDRV